MKLAEYVAQDGLGLAELVKRGEVSARELAQTAIERIDALNPKLNAVIHTLYDDGLKAADEPPLDPLGERVRSHGLRVGPNSSGSVTFETPNSGVLVLPKITRPALR
jgi:hypothetical protein